VHAFWAPWLYTPTDGSQAPEMQQQARGPRRKTDTKIPDRREKSPPRVSKAMAHACSGIARAGNQGGMPVFMRMIYDEKLAQAAYLIGCQRTGEAVVIDPERDVDRYIDLAKDNGLRIVATAETHIHADFVSGSRELAERVGAKVYVSDEGDADWKYEWLDKKVGGGSYDHQLLKDGDSFKIGNIELKAIHTPGTRPSTSCSW
jgi:glyoxylase-like metal-dependent hydrolase (beta-lactamase superfamily II)